MNSRCFKHGLFKALIGLGVLFLVGCTGGDRMLEVSNSKVRSAPNPTEAMVIFLRPTSLYKNRSAILLDVTDGTPEFIGILPAWKKIAYPVAPGIRKLMVAATGRKASFITAELAPGKTYYLRAIPEFWAGRISFEPYRGAELDTPEFAEHFEDSGWVVNTPNSRLWAQKNRSSIIEKFAGYAEWASQPNRPTVRPEDGR